MTSSNDNTESSRPSEATALLPKESNEMSAPENCMISSPPLRSIDEFLDEAYANAALPSPCILRTTLFKRTRFYLVVLSLGIANSSFSCGVLLISYLLADDAFVSAILHHNESSASGGLLASSIFGGMLVGGLSVGPLSDRMGRKPPLLLALGAHTLAGAATAVSSDVFVLSFFRFLAGLAIGSMEPPMFTLITELSPPSKRGLLVTVVASFWMVGNIYIAIAGMAVFQCWGLSWRWYVALCTLPSASAFCLVAAFVPESPRFLAAAPAATRHKIEEAVQISNEVATMMGFDTFSARGRQLRIEEVLQRHRKRVPRSSEKDEFEVGKTTMDAPFSDLKRSWSLLYTPKLRKGTTLPLQVIWFNICFGSSTLMEWINAIFVRVHLYDVYFNLLMFALANLPGNIASYFLVDLRGRVPVFRWSMCLSSISLVAFSSFARSNDIDSTEEIIFSACLFRVAETAAWNALDVMTGELFPTNVRSTGIGVCTATGRIGGVLAQFVGAALIAEPDVLLLVATFCFVLGTLTSWFLEHGEMTCLPLADGLSTERSASGLPVALDKNDGQSYLA